MEKKISYSTEIPCFMADRHKLLRPVSFFDMDVKFLKPVRRDDKVTINTWHRGQQSIFFIRDYELLDESGERPQNEERVTEEDARKVVVPHDAVLQKVDGHRVAYSDIDVNQHVNNARYIAWAMDAIPEVVVNDRPVSEVSINFIKEAVPGEVVDLYHAEAEGVHFVEGKVADSVIFTTRFVF